MKSAIKKLSLLVVSSGLLLTSGVLAGNLASAQKDDFVDLSVMLRNLLDINTFYVLKVTRMNLLLKMLIKSFSIIIMTTEITLIEHSISGVKPLMVRNITVPLPMPVKICPSKLTSVKTPIAN